MKKIASKGICVLICVFAASLFCSAAFSAGRTDFQKLLEPRVATCWVEGSVLDDIVLGARGRLDFVCVDERLGDMLSRLRLGEGRELEFESAPEWLRVYGRDYNKHRGKKILFVLKIEAFKPWSFDTTELCIGDYRIASEDIQIGFKLDPSLEIRAGRTELPGGYVGETCFFVPSEFVGKKSLKVGYGEDRVPWTRPFK